MMIEVQPHGIYERSDGCIVGPCLPGFWPDAGDLQREIVVGEGWLPWLGGELTIFAEDVEVILRSGTRLKNQAWRLRWEQSAAMPEHDIVAYRVLTTADDKIAALHSVVAGLREKLTVAEAVAKQCVAKDKAMHRDAKLWRDLRRLLAEATRDAAK